MRFPWLHLFPRFRRAAPPQITPAPVRPDALRYSLVPSKGLDVSTLSSADRRIAPLVVLEGRDLPLELHCNLTATQSRSLAIRLLQAADSCDEVSKMRSASF